MSDLSTVVATKSWASVPGAPGPRFMRRVHAGKRRMNPGLGCRLGVDLDGSAVRRHRDPSRGVSLRERSQFGGKTHDCSQRKFYPEDGPAKGTGRERGDRRSAWSGYRHRADEPSRSRLHDVPVQELEHNPCGRRARLRVRQVAGTSQRESLVELDPILTSRRPSGFVMGSEHFRISRLGALVLLAGLIAGGSTGCAAATSDTSNPYAALFEQARSQATTDFERAALEDDEITRAEYEEGVNRYVECMASQGASVSPIDQFGYFVFETSDSAAYERADPQCRLGTIEHVEPLYVDILTNPQMQPHLVLVAECLTARGVVEPGFDDADLQRALDEEDSAVAAAPEFAECMANPVGNDE